MNTEIDVELAAESLRIRIRTGKLEVNQWSDWIALFGAKVVAQVVKEEVGKRDEQ